MADDLKDLKLASDDMLESIYEKVLTPVFTSDELEPLKNLRKYLKATPAETFGLYAVDPGGDPIGCCIYYPYGGDDDGGSDSDGDADSDGDGDSDREPGWKVLLLGYMAVVEGGRSSGVGTRLFVESQKEWFGSHQYDLVVAELDDPRVYEVVNGIDPEKRITFYSRLGADLICARYFAPRVRRDGERVYDMLLTVLGGSPRARHSSSGTVSGDCVATFLTEYFTAEDEFTSKEGGSSEPNVRDLAWLIDAYNKHELRVIPVADFRSWDPPKPPSKAST